MSEQIFISYRRTGGDVSAKLICEALKNQGFTVFYDYDSLHGGFFDTRIISAIEGCEDVVLVLPPHALDRCVNEDDWVRQEIVTALKHKKNITPVMLPDFSFPADLPAEIAEVARINGVPFSMPFFDAMIDTIVDRLRSKPDPRFQKSEVEEDVELPTEETENFSFRLNKDGTYTVSCRKCHDETVTIPAEYHGRVVTRIADEAFNKAKSLKEIRIPDSVLQIGANAFEQCTALTEITFSDHLESIGACAFLGCKSLTRVTLPDTVTTIGERAFENCDSLERIKLPASLTRIPDGMLSRCEALESLTIPAKVTEIGTAAFYRCKSLFEVTLPIALTQIPSELFYECRSLRRVTIPKNVRKIGADAFFRCSSLREVSLGDDLSHIAESAFAKCSSLRSIQLPSRISYIGNKAFAKCHAFLKVEYWGGKDGWEKVSKSSSSFPSFASLKIKELF